MTSSKVSGDSTKASILLVDDRVEGLIALEAALTDPRYHLVKAQSGSAALSEVLKHDFALILMDVQMPGMDGFEAASLIKNRDRSKNVPVIFMTAFSKDYDFIAEGYDVGGVDYLFKPIDPTILRSKVAVFVDLYFKNIQLREHMVLLRESEIQNRIRLVTEIELENLRRYRNLANAIHQIVWKASKTGEMEYFNKFWTQFSGLSNDQSQEDGWQSAFNAEDLDVFLRTWEDARCKQIDFEVECRIRRGSDKQELWHLIRGVPEFTDNNQFVGWVGSCTNIHDRKEVERQLRIAKESSEFANREKSRFLANVSHELRTPLGVMLGFVELLPAPDTETDSESAECLEKIRRSGRQLSKIIDDILDISKVEAGRLEIESIEFSILDVLKEVILCMDLPAKEKGLSLIGNIDGTIPEYVRSDPSRIRQILMNVIGNAIKFTEKGEVKVLVRYFESSNGVYLEFTVEDTGRGISSDQSQRLFQPFTQLDASITRKFGGTGLGLSLSRTLSRALGGDLLLYKSEPGLGSAFKVTVRIEPASSFRMVDSAAFINSQQSIGKGVQGSSLPRLDGLRVLLVEDSKDNQIMVSRFLELSGAKTEVANNGLEGFEKAIAGDHDLVLMDIQMPELDGYSATLQLRERGYQKPIIALTAHALREEKEKCLQAGCNDHLTKPIDRKILIECLFRFLRAKVA